MLTYSELAPGVRRMGAAEPAASPQPRVSFEGLLLATRRLHLKYLLAAALPIYLNNMLHFLGQPWVWGVPLALLVATLFLAHRRSIFALLPAYFLFAQVWAALWLLAPKAGLPLQVDYVIVADRVLGLGQLPTVWLQDRFHGLPAAEIFEVPIVAVYATFFLANQIVLFALFFGNRRLAGRYAVALLTAAYLSVAVMTLVPTAPPWMAAEQGATPEIARIAHEILRGVDESTFEAGYQAARINEVAAMPSMHMAATVVIAIAAWRASARLRPWGVGYAAAMGFALVYLGEHYLIDVVVGALFALIGWRVADWAFALPIWRRRGSAAEPAEAVSAEPEARAA